jgi:uncharacterized membrane protein
MSAPIRVHLAETIARPVEVVYAALIDVAGYPGWQGGVLEIRRLDDGPLRVGSRILEVRELMGRKIEGTTEITALEPGRLMGFSCPEGAIPFKGSYVCTPDGGGTRVDIEMELSPTGFLSMARAFLPSMFGKMLGANFRELKEQLERS